MSLLEELIGQVLDEKYRIDKQLGQGGMGAVYLATHLGTGRPVALKVIVPQFMAHQESVERFKREAKAAGLLRHPNIVDVTDFGFADVDSHHVAYLVMEYLDGVSLGEVLKEEKKLPLTWVVDILEQVCLAIDKAHQQGIIHRDLKPDNIWLEPNERGGFTVKILDFGLARLATTSLHSADELQATLLQSTLIDGANEPQAISFRTADTHEQRKVDTKSIHPSTQLGGLTQAGAVLGTPFYMSPEQCLGKPLDIRSDIYSLGVIAYEMLAGERPFSGNSTQELITQHTQVSPPPLENKRHDVPKRVRTLVHSTLAKDPADRPASAAAFASALRARAEGVGAIMRQAFTLYSEHFTTFFLISLIAYIPQIFLIFWEALYIGLKKSGSSFASISLPFSFALFILSSMFATVISAGVFVPVIAQLLIAPLRPVEVLPAFIALKKRMHAFVTSTLLFYVVAALFFLCAILVFVSVSIPISAWIDKGPPRKPLLYLVVLTACILLFTFIGLKAFKAFVNYLLYAPVIIMEGLSRRAALSRSKELVGRLRPTLINLLMIYIAFTVVVQVPFRYIHEHFVEGQNSLPLSIIVGTTSEIISFILAVLLNPLISAALALIYFKTRQTSGETLKQVLGRYEQEALAPSNWQTRLREHLHTHIQSSRSQR